MNTSRKKILMKTKFRKNLSNKRKQYKENKKCIDKTNIEKAKDKRTTGNKIITEMT